MLFAWLVGPYSEKLWPRSDFRICRISFPKSEGLRELSPLDLGKFSSLRDLGKKAHASVTVTMIRNRKIWTALRTNQIVGFVTVPTWKKMIFFIT